MGFPGKIIMRPTLLPNISSKIPHISHRLLCRRFDRFRNMRCLSQVVYGRSDGTGDGLEGLTILTDRAAAGSE